MSGFQNLPSYTVSDHGIVGLARTAALKHAKNGIYTNAVCPRAVHLARVDRILQEHPVMRLVAGEPVGRMGTPEEIVPSVIWLCPHHASFVTLQLFLRSKLANHFSQMLAQLSVMWL
ncbi:SDR family oxidoreductase [Noviherbaspirillum sp. 17J57-3]|uniref:SDR family oxidoreductase n=1 Tax=Noviherbaspirillum galbum TaxID=2709383 RepID=A0A6B3SGF5_9BURK|nr:SDR family oxidoreductase [Noviherbaspirillum galbum]